MMDEFHAVRDVESKNWRVAGSLIGAFNVLQQEGLPASLVLCGLPSVAPNAVSARSYSERMFGYMEVSSLSAGEAKSAIFEPLGRTDRSFSDETADAVVRDTGGHPYFLQFFASEILGRVDARHVRLEDYGRVRQSVVEKLGRDFFSQREAPVSGTRKKILVEIALAKGDARFSSICRKTGAGKGAVSGHLKRLEEKGAIYRHRRGLYRFAMPMFWGIHPRPRRQTGAAGLVPSVSFLLRLRGAPRRPRGAVSKVSFLPRLKTAPGGGSGGGVSKVSFPARPR